MLRSLFPKCSHKFLSMPLLGPIADGFDDWLSSHGYTRWSRGFAIRMLPHIDADLRRRHVCEVSSLTHEMFFRCWRNLNRTFPDRAGTAWRLEEYLIASGVIAVGQLEGPSVISTASIVSEEYGTFLRELRGFAAGTVSHHIYVSKCFLNHLHARKISLEAIRRSDVEAYVSRAGKRLSRASLQHDIAAVRGLLRFLALDGRVPTGLDRQIDTPRLYRLEQLPRALPWDRVRTLLQSIDTTSAIGLRDYAMLLLVATYGLRASEIVAVTLDDIDWRAGSLRIHQRKTSSPLELPLTNEVSTAIVRHLKRTPPPKPHRRIFLRMRAPRGQLKPTAVTEVFQAVVRRSGLTVPVQGPHCLRHSLAVHLLKSGTPLKTIGDILGHRTAESTSMYLRLATSDLREVPLPVPGKSRPTKVVTGTLAFSSVISPVLARYVNLKRSLGRRFATATRTLQSLDKFLHNASDTYSDLTAEAFRAWCLTQEAVSSGVRRVRMLEVYNFCLYRQRTESQCFLPDPSTFPTYHQRLKPYIFSEAEVAAMLNAASGLKQSPSSPLRPEVIRLSIILLFTTGIRRGELLNLTVGDYSRQEATLHIRQTKFYKSRLLPINSEIAGEIEHYLRARVRRRLPTSPETRLIWNATQGGRAYTGTGLQDCLRPLLQQCGITTVKGKLPRIQDLRHSFAVNALMRWYRAGVDVDSKLPMLATYLGHGSALSTHHYLHFIEPLRTAASERFAKHYGELIAPLPQRQRRRR